MDRLTSMRVFQKVVDEGGFAAAARTLDMSPAVVTRLVADLEEHLGTRLLHRSTRRLSLSEAGETYLARVRGILQDIDEADDLAAARTRELAGVLRILAPPVMATHMLGPVMAGFRQLYPRIHLDIQVATYREPPVEDFDITLMGPDAVLMPELIARRIIDSEAILVASPAYLQRRGTPRSPADLAGHDGLLLKLRDAHPAGWRLMQGEGDQKQTADATVLPVLRANHTDTLLRAALDGAGITSSVFELVTPYLVSGELQRVLQPWITARLTLYAALPSRKYLPRRTSVFLDYLIEQTRLQMTRAVAACQNC